jgi:hypothetical protein
MQIKPRHFFAKDRLLTRAARIRVVRLPLSEPRPLGSGLLFDRRLMDRRLTDRLLTRAARIRVVRLPLSEPRPLGSGLLFDRRLMDRRLTDRLLTRAARIRAARIREISRACTNVPVTRSRPGGVRLICSDKVRNFACRPVWARAFQKSVFRAARVSKRSNRSLTVAARKQPVCRLLKSPAVWARRHWMAHEPKE